MSHEAACEELRREAGRQFDANVVEAMLEEFGGRDGDSPTARLAEVESSTLAARAAEVAASLRKVLVRASATDTTAKVPSEHEPA